MKTPAYQISLFQPMIGEWYFTLKLQYDLRNFSMVFF